MKTIIFLAADDVKEPKNLKNLPDCVMVRSFAELAAEILACQNNPVRIFLHCHGLEGKLYLFDSVVGLSRAEFVERVFQDFPNVNLEAIYIAACYAGSHILQTKKQGKIIDDTAEKKLQEEVDKHPNLKLILCNGKGANYAGKFHVTSSLVGLSSDYSAEVALIPPIMCGLLQTIKILTQGKEAVKISTSMLKIKGIEEILRDKNADEIKEIYTEYLVGELCKLDSQETSNFDHRKTVEEALPTIAYESFLRKIQLGRTDSVATYIKYKDKLKFLNFNHQHKIIFDCDPVFLATEKHFLEILQLLATTDVSPNGDLAKYQHGSTPLIEACEAQDVDVVFRLLNFPTIDVNKVRTSDGATAAHIICANKASNILQQLLFRDAAINIKRNDGSTPLHLACEKARWNIIEELADGSIEKIKEVVNETRACDGATALYLACDQEYKLVKDEAEEFAQNQQLEAVQSLLFCGADPTLPTKDGKTPILVACKKQNVAILKAMTQKIISDIEKYDFDKLSRALENCFTEVSAQRNGNPDLFEPLSELQENMRQQRQSPHPAVEGRKAERVKNKVNVATAAK